MSLFTRMIPVIFFSAALVSASGRPCFPQENNVRAKIGILVKSGDQVARAKSRDRVKAGDLIRIYVHPEASSYVYVIHTDQKQATMLNMVEQKIHSSTLVLPSLQEFYQVDGNSQVESFTVICSSEEVKEVSTLLGSQMDHQKWSSLQKELVKKGEIDLAQKTERPFGIAGNVRGTADAGDPFVKELQIFSGKTLIVKQYEFSVKKQ